ncbi:hypothetical protein DRN67_04540 [Candidatus Micrarchaeota archaeon]|nr:MAG: hypothetical protein DRN67_04540 [Candidatus Micrarchaeota archaeon]
MNNKGILCFTILLAFASMQLDFLNESSNAREQLQRVKATAIEAEQLNAIRTAIEINTDMIIEQAMQAKLLQDKEAEEIKRAVNQNLLRFARAVEETFQENPQTVFHSSKGPLTLQFLNENSKVNVIKADNKVITAEYTFTGGLLKNKVVFAEIRGDHVSQIFQIPAGYTVKAVISK